MIIQRVRFTNYKTYLSLDLDLNVDGERPIILIGGSNGGGKTTLFEGICGALYGLKISTKDDFLELLNNGAPQSSDPEIILEVTFMGMVLSSPQKYVLRRTYKLNPAGKPIESVSLNMNGSHFVYGTATAPAQRAAAEQQVNKIIKANLPQELSKYFLFDAMQSSELLKKNVFAQIIRDNIENVMGFKKYVQLKRAAERLQQEWAQQRLDAQKEAEEYEELCKTKARKEQDLQHIEAEMDGLYKFLVNTQDEYEKAKAGADSAAGIQKRITDCTEKINAATKGAADFTDDLRAFVEDFEMDVILPRISQQLQGEIEQIFRLKEEIKKHSANSCSADTIRSITDKVLHYLRGLSLLNTQVDEENIVQHVLALQGSEHPKDKYHYLEEDELQALRTLLDNKRSNRFTLLERMRTELEAQIANIPRWQSERDTLQASLVGGNETLIANYEQAQRALEKYKKDTAKLQAEIKSLENQIHRFDIQIQQEPDVKFDTLVKLRPFFEEVADALLKTKKAQIETEMQQQLNRLLVSYKGCIAKVELAESVEHFDIRLYHKAGNLISLNQLNAASKQIFIQVLLKVLRNLGDYNPPVMIDTVMGVLDEESRDALMEEYFPQLAEQTILLCTTSEIRKDTDYIKLEPFISKTYTLKRIVEEQRTTVEEGYFGKPLNA